MVAARILAVVAALVVIVATAATVDAQSPIALNDIGALSQGSGQTPDKAKTQTDPNEPPLTATPRAKCDAGSKPEPGIQGRVPAGTNKDGFICNLQLVSHQGTSGGFKVHRYVDAQGRECAFYDTALLFPLNTVNAGGPTAGVAVLDMSNPAKPVQTATLLDPPMDSPHESLNLNAARGLLAAVNGNPATEPGLVSVYSVRDDCRHPVLQSTGLLARFGHESGFSADGNTFYATGTGTTSITAIDVSDPQNPKSVWQGNVISHGMSLSDDGNRAYINDVQTGEMAILDTSQIQARKPDPQVREISRMTWKSASIPQNSLPFTRDGKPYLLEFDEYTQGTTRPDGNQDAVGAARIIDISDETKPHIVSNLRLAIDNPDEHKAAREAGDPGTKNPTQGYAAHYCNVPTRDNPRIVACSFIASGLRLFDISDLAKPKEIGYFIAPPTQRIENGTDGSNFAMSQPAFAPDRREVWYTDGVTGFYALRVNADVWPSKAGSGGSGGPGACTARTRSKRVAVRRGGRTTIRAVLTKGGKRARGAVVRVSGPGFKRRAKTNAHGVVRFRVRARRSGRATVSTRVCGGRLKVKATRAAARRRGGARFTG